MTKGDLTAEVLRYIDTTFIQIQSIIPLFNDVHVVVLLLLSDRGC
mgnify:FL=1